MRISQGLQISRNQVIEKYTKVVNLGLVKRISLIEQDNFDCVFWDKGGCTIYNHRPLQCQAFPFWPQNLDNPAAWVETSDECPGIDHGARHSKDTIEKWLKRRTLEPFLKP
jgi:Fe-S-cluster containining protein